jgi:3-oxocholest-4-en-26-oyl-CoA dehydrogenase beta subunit
MDFLLNASDLELAALTRSILAGGRRIGTAADGTTGAAAGLDDGLWADLAKAGVLSAGLPESLDGADAGLLAQCAVLTEIGRVIAPVPYLESIMLGAGAVARFGTPEQQRRWAGPAGRGELLLTAALAEPDGDDPAQPTTTAAPTTHSPATTPPPPHPPATDAPPAQPSATGAPPAGDWVLSGVKTLVGAAPEANWLLVPAATPDGTAVFLVGAGAPGVTVQRQQATGGLSTGQLVLADVAVPADQVLGGPDGQRAAAWLAAHGMVGLCALQLGVLERALEMTAEYTQSRVQFGRPIGTFQAVRQRLADAYTDVAAVRLTMWQAAWQLAEGLPASTAIATAKFWAADAGHRVAHTAVHLHGGVGIDVSYPLYRYFTAAKRGEFALGGATTQLRHIGAALAQSS